MEETERNTLKELLTNYLNPKTEEIPQDFSTINDMTKLISYWQTTFPGSEPEKLIKARMAELLKEVLPYISDIEKLISYWRSTPADSEPRNLIEARMAEVLNEVSLDKVPQWFQEMLQNPERIPNCLHEQFTAKAKQLLAAC